MQAARSSDFEPLKADLPEGSDGPEPVLHDPGSTGPLPPTPFGTAESAGGDTALATSDATPPAAPAGLAPTALEGQSAAASPAAPAMDRDFIARNQIIERYLAGKLPVRGATDFERFCKEHPELLDELGLPERVSAGVRLLEASGKPEPWREQPKRFWENPLLPAGLALVAIVLLLTTVTLARSQAAASRAVAKLSRRLAAQPLKPADSTRVIRLLPSHDGPSRTPAVIIGGENGQAQLADLLLDLTRSPYRQYRVTIDRIGEGRVAIINDLAKDSNGHLRIALNSSALGPGNYEFIIEGLTWRGEPEPDAWVTIGIQH